MFKIRKCSSNREWYFSKKICLFALQREIFFCSQTKEKSMCGNFLCGIHVGRSNNFVFLLFQTESPFGSFNLVLEFLMHSKGFTFQSNCIHEQMFMKLQNEMWKKRIQFKFQMHAQFERQLSWIFDRFKVSFFLFSPVSVCFIHSLATRILFVCPSWCSIKNIQKPKTLHVCWKMYTFFFN